MALISIISYFTQCKFLIDCGSARKRIDVSASLKQRHLDLDGLVSVLASVCLTKTLFVIANCLAFIINLKSPNQTAKLWMVFLPVSQRVPV